MRALLRIASSNFATGLLDTCLLSRILAPLASSRLLRRELAISSYLNGLLFFFTAILLECYLPRSLNLLLSYFSASELELMYLPTVIKSAFVSLWIYPLYFISMAAGLLWNQSIVTQACHLAELKSVARAETGVQLILINLVEDCYALLVTAAFFVQLNLLSFLPSLGSLSTTIHFAWLYAFFAYDYRWRLEGFTVLERLELVENYWDYMLGFGLPPALLAVTLPKYIGLASLALIMPFQLLLAIFAPLPSPAPSSLPLFRLARASIARSMKTVAYFLTILDCLSNKLRRYKRNTESE